MSLKSVAEKPEESTYVLIEFTGPGSAMIKDMESSHLAPAQLWVLAKMFELEGSNAYVEQRNRTAAALEAVQKKILKPS
jgi:hypothetical protein